MTKKRLTVIVLVALFAWATPVYGELKPKLTIEARFEKLELAMEGAAACIFSLNKKIEAQEETMNRLVKIVYTLHKKLKLLEKETDNIIDEINANNKKSNNNSDYLLKRIILLEKLLDKLVNNQEYLHRGMDKSKRSKGGGKSGY